MAKKKKKKPRGNGEKQKRGFALLSSEQRRALGERGARAAHARGTAYQWTSEEARRAADKLWAKRKREKEDDA